MIAGRALALFAAPVSDSFRYGYFYDLAAGHEANFYPFLIPFGGPNFNVETI